VLAAFTPTNTVRPRTFANASRISDSVGAGAASIDCRSSAGSRSPETVSARVTTSMPSGTNKAALSTGTPRLRSSPRVPRQRNFCGAASKAASGAVAVATATSESRAM